MGNRRELSILNPERLFELRLDGGERLPIIKVEGSAPPVMTTVYTVSMLRSGGRSPNTIAERLRAIMIARRWAVMRGLSLEERMQAGMLLSEREIEDIVRALRSRQRAMPDGPEIERPATRERRSGPEALRRVVGETEGSVDPAVAAKRIGFVRDYLVWLARFSRRQGIDVEITRMAAALSARAKVRSDTP
jgi:hypothetical protein